MIQIHQYRSIQDKYRFIENFDFSNSTLIVPDLSSKLLWQDFLLQKQGYIDGPQILRAADLWKALVSRGFPELEIVSSAWMTVYLKDLLTKEFTSSFGLPFAKSSTALKALNELLPIISHPDSEEVMENWFESEDHKDCTWKNWFYLSHAIWSHLQSKNVILNEWCSSFLLQHSKLESLWSRPLVVDLGPELRTTEVELLQTLSQYMAVYLLSPKPTWSEEFPWVEYPYKFLQSRSHTNKVLPEASSAPSTVSFKRLPSHLAEIKFAVGQIRAWKADGIPFDHISVVAPDIEEYWSTLKWHLRQENIPFEKQDTTKANNLGSIMAWLASLKKRVSPKPRKSDLQIAQFHPYNQSEETFSHFQAQWSKRSPPPKELGSLENQKDLTSQEMNAGLFLEWALDLWPQKSLLQTSSLLGIFRKWLLETDRLGPQSPSKWIEFLELYLSHQEITLHPANPCGLHLGSLMGGIPQRRTHQIFLGCSESQLKSSSGMVGGSDVMSLQFHTGHLLAHPDRDFREFQLNLLYKQSLHQIFSFPEMDFGGNELVPSVFWLKGKELENGTLHHMDPWIPAHWETHLLNQRLETEAETVHLPLNWSMTVSPGSLQTYNRCPFRFLAERGFRLSDLPLVDLDLDPRTQGSIKHRLLELLTPNEFRAPTLRTSLPDFVLQVLEEFKEEFYSEETRQITKSQLLQFGDLFLSHEENYRKEYPRFSTIAREAWFQRDISKGTRKISFRGKIDRIDISSDQTEAVVIDYKNDTSSYRGASSWLNNFEFQLPAYASAVEGGFATSESKNKIPPTPVVAAHYYSLKDFSRKGFTMKEVSPGVVETPTSKSLIPQETKQQILKDFETIAQTSIEKMMDGDFSPIPHSSTDCKTCPWRYLCRSKKQNL